ncbi:hypothetical protein JQX13_38165 [Archangium violaceum]|uniref:hypothetical protein n=1 Tax=Archangium violaceum TaxID=83451 RepID=UPI00193C0DCA|nr:hypothetical protein [Archangium violaceum]QRK05920.1 hypothetical protein JQX13_38165 [Archangium violaceum]
MKRIVLAGLMVWGLGSTACRDEPVPLATGVEGRGPDGRGGLSPEPGADMGELQRLESQQREQYEAIANDVGVQTWPGERRVEVPGGEQEQSGQGGSGQAGIPQEWRGCARALDTPEPSSVVTGTVRHVSKDLLTLEDRTGRRMDLHADPRTCMLWNGEPVQPTQLGEGTAVRVSFVVDPEDGATARVVRVIEQQRPAP